MRSCSTMPRLLLCLTFTLLGLVACKRGAERKSGPAVATVGGDTITADEFKRRLDEVSPFLRARYNTVERKKEFLENIIRNELLAQEAERRGLDKTPAVREQTKRAMIQELLKQQLDQRLSGSDLADAELKQFYDAHQEDFVKPDRARARVPHPGRGEAGRREGPRCRPQDRARAPPGDRSAREEGRHRGLSGG